MNMTDGSVPVWMVHKAVYRLIWHQVRLESHSLLSSPIIYKSVTNDVVTWAN